MAVYEKVPRMTALVPRIEVLQWCHTNELKAAGKGFWLSVTLAFFFGILQSAQAVESRTIEEILATI